MKKIIVVLAVLIMGVMLFSACNNSSTGSSAGADGDYENDGEIIVMAPTQNAES